MYKSCFKTELNWRNSHCGTCFVPSDSTISIRPAFKLLKLLNRYKLCRRDDCTSLWQQNIPVEQRPGQPQELGCRKALET